MHASTVNIPFMAAAAVATALFWGIYGPLLTKGHQEMKVPNAEGKLESVGRLRPFICVGVAYLLVAVIAPALLIQFGIMEPGEGLTAGWTLKGIWWSLIAGGAGALGALFLLIALNYAPTKPSPALYVMPLVFGCAPVINTFYTMWTKGTWITNPFFVAGLILVGVGAVTVLISANFGGAAKAEEKAPIVKAAEGDEKTPLKKAAESGKDEAEEESPAEK